MLGFLVDRAVASRFAGSFPLGTLTVKLTGALLLGRSGLATALLNLGGAYQALGEAHKDSRYVCKAVEALQESLTISGQLRSADAQAKAATTSVWPCALSGCSTPGSSVCKKRWPTLRISSPADELNR